MKLKQATWMEEEHVQGGHCHEPRENHMDGRRARPGRSLSRAQGRMKEEYRFGWEGMGTKRGRWVGEFPKAGLVGGGVT